MAKLNHVLFGQAKGKVGGVVLQRYEGMNIAREKPISVKNPQSDKQVKQRAKFKNASQFLATFKDAIIPRFAKLSIYDRSRRAIAINALTRVIEITGEDSAQVSLSDAISALNAKSMTEYSAPTVTTSGSNYSVTAPADAIIIGVIAGYDSNGTFVSRKVVSATSEGSAVTFTVLNDVASQNAMFLYTIASTEEGRAILENQYSIDGDFTVDIVRLINEGSLDVSDLAGTTVSE